jgi:hypothetical protein
MQKTIPLNQPQVNPAPSVIKKIDPPWKRAAFGILGVAMIPAAVIILGFILGILWRLFAWAFRLGQGLIF